MRNDTSGSAGPSRNYLNVVTANIHSLSSRVEEVAAWDADIVLLQETKLAAHAIKDSSEVARDHGWRLVHGKPCSAPNKAGSKVKAAAEANSGGVAAMVRRPRRVIAHQLDKQAADLHDTARWLEVRTACGGGRCLTTSTMYGISGSNSNPRRMKQNEALLSDALARLIDADDDPYLLMGDLNVTPETSPTIAAAVDAGLVIDVGHLWAEKVTTDHEGLERRCPEPTFCRDGPAPGMEGQGVSRIDVVLANPVAAAAVRDFALRWDLVQVDHVPAQVTLDLDELDAMEVVHKTRGLVDAKGLPDRDDPKWDQALQTAQDMYAPRLQAALDKRDLDEAHIAWNLMAEACIKLAAGGQRSAVEEWLKASPMRGAPPRFAKRQRRKPVDKLGNPTTYRQRRMNNIRNKLLDLRARLKRFDDGSADSTPWNGEQGHGALDFEVKLWDDIEDKLARLIGKHRVANVVSAGCPGLPTFREMDNLLNLLLAEHGSEGARARSRRTAERKSRMKWDWDRNFGREAFASSRVGYAPPTFALQDEDRKGRYITSTEAIHDEFLKFWSTVYCAHSEESEGRWQAFFETYGDYVPHADFHDRPYEFSDYEEQL
jgi:exonuclease III